MQRRNLHTADAAGPTALLFATAAAAEGGPAALLEAAGTTFVGRLLQQLASLGVAGRWVVTRPEWQPALESALAGRGTDVEVIASEDLRGDLREAAALARRIPGPLVVGDAHVLTHGEALAQLVGDPRVTTGVLVPESTEFSVGLLRIDRNDLGRLVAGAGELGQLEIDRSAGKANAAPALLLAGLVRGGAEVASREVGRFFWAAPLSREAAGVAASELTRHDEERARLDSAVKADDSPFTTFLVSPYSKYLARFAARRGWSPDAVTMLSLAIGVAAAASFAAGSRASLIAGALLLQLSFTADCVDGQLARYARRFSRLGSWLDTVADRAKEYLVYAGLALGATRGFDDDVWLLAASALALQTIRHISDFAWVVDRPEAGAPAGAAGWIRRVNQVVRLPIGERLALISLTAAVASPRVTFVALLAWGGVGAAFAFAVRVVLSFATRPRVPGAVLQ
jgi:phosphatidylglycerophosphate synthase